MKKVLVTITLVLSMMMLINCDGGTSKSGISSKIDLNILSNKEEFKKIYDDIVNKLGEQVNYVDQVDIAIRNPAEQQIQKADDVVELNITVYSLHPNNPKKLQRLNYWSKYKGWQQPQVYEVDLTRASDKEKENFVLKDNLWDFKEKINFETAWKVIEDAWSKDDDSNNKYTYRYIYSIYFKEQGYEVNVHAKLASNDQKMNKLYKYNLNGVLIK